MNVFFDIYKDTFYYLGLTIKTEILWTVLPLAISTIVMLFYFQRHKEEDPGWNTHVANSLVLLFVGMNLLRYIFNLDGAGAINFYLYPTKTIISAAVLLMGVLILLLNFEHFLPERVARQISSPLTVNLIAYIIILYTYTGITTLEKISLTPSESIPAKIFSLVIIFFILIGALNLIKSSVRRMFLYLRRMKEREKVEEVIKNKKDLLSKKKEVKKEEKKLKAKKQIVKKNEKQVVKAMLREFNKQKNEAMKLKKIFRSYRDLS